MANTDRYECLKTEIEGYIGYSQKWMRIWAGVYYCLRTTLIVLTACAAAKEAFSFVNAHLTIISLIIAIGTSLDTWLKTGTRYRGHYVFNDKFIALQTDLELTDSGDTATLGKIQEQFKKHVEEYAVAVLPG